jgi:uncharacterized protein
VAACESGGACAGPDRYDGVFRDKRVMSVEPFDCPVVGTDQRSHHGPVPLLAPIVAAFIGRTERGPINDPIAITGLDDYRRRFGGNCEFSFLPQAVEQYFAHGGHSALVVRVANGATRGRLELPAGDGVLQLQARQPGSRECLRASVDYDRVKHHSDRFNLVVQRVYRQGSELVEDQELYPALSIDPADERYIVDALQDSELVRVAGTVPGQRPNATQAVHPGQPIPYVPMTAFGHDGEDLTDYDLIGSNTLGTGLFALDRAERVDVICIPVQPDRDTGSITFVAAERYCERRKSLLIWDPPLSWTSPHDAIAELRAAGLTSHNALTYYPRFAPRERDETIGQPGVPACGAIAGLIAATARRGYWGPLSDAAAVFKAGTMPIDRVCDRDATVLNRYGINVIGRVGRGACGLRGNVSMVGPNLIGRLWQRLDRRRAALFILGTVERGTRWSVGALGDPELAAKVARQVGTFLSSLHEQGALAGQRAEQAWFVRVDPAFRGRAPFVFRFGIALDQPNEFMTYEIRHEIRGSSTRALAGLEVRELVG